MTELPLPSAGEQLVEKAKSKTEISDTLDAAAVKALKDPAEQQKLIDAALQMRDKSTVEHLAKELRETRSKFREQKEDVEAAAAAATLETVETQINAHAATLPVAPAATPAAAPANSSLASMSEYAKPVLDALSKGWETVKSWIPSFQGMIGPLMEGFEYVKKEIQSALKAMGPQAAGMMKMIGIEIPEFLKPEPKLLTTVKAVFKKANLTVEPQVDDNVGAQLEQINAAHRAHVTEVGSVSMDAYLADAAAEAKALHPGSDSITLNDVLLGAESLKAKRKRLAGVPSEKATTATDK